MIKRFQIEDLGCFLPNEFSNPDVVLDQLVDPAFDVQTMWGDDGMVQAIICCRNYWGRNWMGFFLIANPFPVQAARTLRSYIRAAMEERDAVRLQTDSVATDCLRKWHAFMGFKLEGTREKMLFNRDYDCWALMRGGI